MTDFIPPFPQIELTAEEQARYDRNVTSFLCDAVAEYSAQSGHTNQDAWTHVRRRKQLNIYKSVYGTRDPQVTLFKGTGLIHGPVEDVMDGLYCDTTDDLRAAKTLLKYKLVDGCIMNVSEHRSAAAPYRFAGIKWFAAKAAWGLSKHRDVLAYERMGTTTDASGNELAYHVLHSIDHPDWPIDAIKGIKREHQVTCYLYRNHDDTHVESFIWSTVYNLDSVTHRLAEYVVAGTLLNVVGSVNSARAKKYSQLMKHAQQHKWPASSLCHICYGRSFLSTNRPCAGCFQSVCKSCSDYRFIFHIDARTGRPHQQRFCKLCINNTVVISSLDFEASIKKTRKQNSDTDTEVERVALREPKSNANRHTVLQQQQTQPAKVPQTSKSVVDSSLRSNYLDWESDWSSQDDDDDDFMRERTAPKRVKSLSRRTNMVSLSDLHAEDKFAPYPAHPSTFQSQPEGRNQLVRENRRMPQQQLQYQAPPPQYQAPPRRYQAPAHRFQAPPHQYQEPPPQYQAPPRQYPALSSQHQIPPFQNLYQEYELKRPSSARSFTVISTDGSDEVESSSVALMDSGLSHFDLGVVEGAPVEFDDLSMYSDDEYRPHQRAPRYVRSSQLEKDKDGFLSDLYSLSRSQLHGQHY
ncbi:hypothetical protein BBJ28_00006077 [Nothophytophthora sp. Chile5]|nr:hypothetical protein BBJ28_00006077 [Nothophytophthora sp. Chile5]